MRSSIRKIDRVLARLLLLALALWVLPNAWAGSVVTFYGGAGQIGGSSAVVQNGDTRVLVDCGTFYGEEQGVRGVKEEDGFGFDPKSIGKVLLTHAHQDHAGRIPQLVRKGFKGEILMTPPTLTLLKILWRSQVSHETDVRREWVWTERDGGHPKFHWRSDCRWAAKIATRRRRAFTGTRDGLEQYLKKDRNAHSYVSTCQTCQELEVEEIVRHVRTVEFGEPLSVPPFKIAFKPVKHLPGAAAIYFDDGVTKFAFSGDLGTRRSHHVESIAPADPVDAVFVETTYGDDSRSLAEAEAEYKRFREVVGRVVRSGGIAWIPAFALDRSQRVLSEIARGMEDGLIAWDVPVFYLSPSSRAITREYLSHPEWFDNCNPAKMTELFSRSQKRFDVRTQKGGAILLTTSGMMDRGLSYGLIPALVPREDVTVCLSGYQDPATPGARLKKGDKALSIEADGERREVPVRCKVEDFRCFSGHGDARENEAWLMNNMKSRIYLVHGDVESLRARKIGLEKRFGATVEIIRKGLPYVLEATSKSRGGNIK